LALWYWVPISSYLIENIKSTYLYEFHGNFAAIYRSVDDMTSEFTKSYLAYLAQSKNASLNAEYYPFYPLSKLILSTFGINMIDIRFYANFDYWDRNFNLILALIPNIVRFVITAIFLMLYIFRPLKDFALAILYRIIESDKPIFGLLFSATAAAAQAAGWALKKLA
jgi:hypothetical protein